jgi:type IV secretory pathway TraG/TraD family ATPase VirD4
MIKKRQLTFWSAFKLLTSFLLGALMLSMTAPSFKYVITKDFSVVSSECTITQSSSVRSTSTIFNLSQTAEQFTFDTIPEIEAYGKSIPYYCEVTVTKDHKWAIHYKIYDLATREIIDSSTTK